MSDIKDFGIYLIITDPVLSYEEIAEIAVEEGVKMLQLREKCLNDKELISVCGRILRVTTGSQTRFIVNDRPDIASIVSADGFHLGQDDIPLRTACDSFPRNSAGKQLIKGLSTHNLLQVQAAIELEPDYIGFGPVYKTPTKAVPDPLVGTDMLKQVLSISNLPVVAIGGISDSNIDHVLSTGARNIAIVRYFMQTKMLRERIRKIKQRIESFEEEQ